jgi:preprotein translocase subunit YajC
MTFFPFLFGAAEGGAGAAGGGGLMTILPFGLIILIFYFFIIRPQNKKQKETEKMISAVKKGDKVITIGGIHGVVSSTDEKTVVVKVDDDTKIRFNRSAIGSVVRDTPAVEEKTKEEKKPRGRKKVEAKPAETTKEETTGAE